MSICPKNKSSKARRDKRRANWKMSAPNLVKCSKRLPSPGAFLLSLRLVWKRHIKDLTWCVVMCYNGLGEN